MKHLVREAIPYFITLALVLLFYSPLFHTGRALVLADAIDQNVPNRVFAGRTLAEGHLPHWTNAVFCGFPFLSDPQSAVFFPPNLLLAALYPDPGKSEIFDKYALAHIILVALGMVFLSRSLGLQTAGSVGAAIAVTLNGFFVQHFSHTVILGAILCGLWGAGCLARAIRTESWKWAVAGGLCFASAILGGHWQTALYAFYAAGAGGLLLVFDKALCLASIRPLKREMIILAIPFAIAIAGSLIQTMPTLLLLQNSSRSIVDPEMAYTCSWPVRQAPGLLFPSLYQPLPWRIEPSFRNLVDYKNWGADGSYEYLFHAGLAVIALAVFGWLSNWRRGLVQWLFFGALFIWVCSFGERGRLYPILYQYMPGFKQVRIPPRLMWIAAVAWGLLAGLGIDETAKRVRAISARKAALMTAGFVAGIMVVGASALLVAHFHEPGWFATFHKLFVFSPRIVFGKDRTSADFVTDIWNQVGLGAIVGAMLCAWMIAAAKMQKGSTLLATFGILIIYLELGAYGYSKNIGLEYEGYKTATEGSFFDALTDKPAGRIIAAYDPPWGKNSGMVSGDQYARGYNPMVIQWVLHFMPSEDFPRGGVDQENMLNEFNVTLLAWQPSNVDIALGGKKRTIPWAGFVDLAASDQSKPSRMGWKFDVFRPLDRIHLICTAGCALGLANGTEIAHATVYDAHDDIVTTLPIRIGIETAEWTYDNPANPAPNHPRPANSFIKPMDSQYEGGRFYVSSFDIPSSAPVSGVEITATAEPPTFLCVSHMILQYEDVFDARLGMEAVGYRKAKSRKSDWFFATRNGALGWAWMVPEANAVSYKEDFKWVRSHYVDPKFDPAKVVLVNKQQEPAESAAKSNAPDKKSFSGKAELKRGERPEEFSVATDSNQQGWLVISQTWYPGWSAKLDGKPADIVQANGPHTAIAVPAGRHTIQMKYYTPRFLAGACISGATWLAALLFLAFPVQRFLTTKSTKNIKKSDSYLLGAS